METKISSGSRTKVLDEKAGIVEAYVNTMEVIDSDRDIISKDAFNNSFGSLPIPVLASHDQSAQVRKVLSARTVLENEYTQVHRLHATMQMNMETQAGREAFSNVSGDYVREWSVGFNMKPEGAKMDTVDGVSVRVITDLDWVEASTVIRGASPQTQTISAKSQDDMEVNAADSQESQSAPDTAQEAASGTDEVAAFDYGLAELELTKLQLRLSQAVKEA